MSLIDGVIICSFPGCTETVQSRLGDVPNPVNGEKMWAVPAGWTIPESDDIRAGRLTFLTFLCPGHSRGAQ
jgi:hypothetical protein